MRDGQSRRRNGRSGPRRPDHRKPHHHAPKAAYRPAPQPYRAHEPRPERADREDGAPAVLGPPVEGVLELHPKRYGFLRSSARSYAPQPSDPYVPQPLIQRLNLREGLLLSGPVDASRPGTGPRLARIEQIEGKSPDEYKPRNFD